ncbi:MAG: response regulator [Acidobacteriota bacterium]|nr:response regulator [Acidobacteriota bacterium]
MLGIGDRENLPAIFLIDDDLVSREVIATVLTMEGYEVHTAESGDAAVSALEAGEFLPSIILMDAQLPGLSGLELIQKLRTHTEVSIVAISGSELPKDIASATDGFLLKPFNPDALRNLLAERAPANPPEPAAPVILQETLAQFRQLMPEPTVHQIYTAVVADLKKRHVALEAALAARNSEEIGKIGHAIKGGCGMAGALEAAKIGAELEAKSNDLDYCGKSLNHLTGAIANLESMLEREFTD